MLKQNHWRWRNLRKIQRRRQKVAYRNLGTSILQSPCNVVRNLGMGKLSYGVRSRRRQPKNVVDGLGHGSFRSSRVDGLSPRQLLGDRRLVLEIAHPAVIREQRDFMMSGEV